MQRHLGFEYIDSPREAIQTACIQLNSNGDSILIFYIGLISTIFDFGLSTLSHVKKFITFTQSFELMF